MTEAWVNQEAFCPACGSGLQRSRNNTPVLDFGCLGCRETFELKSKQSNFANKITDGAYAKMLERLGSGKNPNFFFLSYQPACFEVRSFFVVPKHFFTMDIIEKRKPLSASAEQAGWIGCNIILQGIPKQGRIFYLKDRLAIPRNEILDSWQKTLFLRDERKASEKGWILDVMNCLDHLGKREFNLDEVYGFTDSLQAKHPGNRHVKDKIRQQLQLLRDKGYLEFVSRGRYRLS